ncbi:MAG: hypothetical protein HY394_01110 [Candidatus Diapherotrites archaeon]|nr:hypothetical protein [Candidatus Diapherotrites archaeon]
MVYGIFFRPAKVFSSPTTVTLLASNIFTIFLALTEGWSLALVLWVYWLQSVIIGFFQFLKILSLEEFSSDGVSFNGVPVQPTTRTKISVAFFFALHYGFFHLVYAVFLASFFLFQDFSGSSAQAQSQDLFFFFLAAAAFFINHLFSFLHFRNAASAEKPNIGAVMFAPYARIIPMHLTIIFGGVLIATGQAKSALLLFLLLKTGADLAMHLFEHKSQSV